MSIIKYQINFQVIDKISSLKMNLIKNFMTNLELRTLEEEIESYCKSNGLNLVKIHEIRILWTNPQYNQLQLKLGGIHI